MMDCSRALELMSLFIDGELNGKIESNLKQHINTCNSCKREYDIQKSIREILINMPPVELPADFNTRLHQKLTELESTLSVKQKFWQRSRGLFKAAVLAASFILVIAFAINMSNGISSHKIIENSGNTVKTTTQQSQYALNANTSNNTIKAEKSQEPKTDAIKTAGGSSYRGLSPNYERKITKDATIAIETDNVDSCYDKILKMIGESNGYIESSSEATSNDSTRMVNLVLKIPEDKFENSITYIKSLGNVTALRIGSNDVTEQYYDVQARIKNFEIQEQKLQEILNKANTVSEILQVESEINRVRTEIDSLKGQLKMWDSLTSLSTINLSIKELRVSKDSISFISMSGIRNDIVKAAVTSINFLILLLRKSIILFIMVIPYLIIISIGYKVYIYFKKRG